MKTLFKSTDVIRFLYSFDCSMTAEDIRTKSKNSEFLDTEFVKKFLITEIYTELKQTVNQYTYTK